MADLADTMELNAGPVKPADDEALPPWSILPKLGGALPIGNIPSESDLSSIAPYFSKKLAALDVEDFVPDAIWRDSFALTGTLRTFFGASLVHTTWQAVCASRRARHFLVAPETARISRSRNDYSWVDINFSFGVTAVPATTASGILSVVPVKGAGWQIWNLRTILERLDGQPSVDELGVSGQLLDNNASAVNGTCDESHFGCVVVGAGQAGLSVAGRLKALGVSYISIDSMASIGDNWGLRYDSATLHTVREYAHLPFERTFGSETEQFLAKDILSRGYKDWVKRYQIKVWLSTTLKSGSWNEGEKLWTLSLDRSGEMRIITADHVVLAVGAGCQIPLMPQYPSQESFKGLVLHSNEYRSANNWKGWRGVVVGSANTAHDIADDMVGSKLSSVTMIQRKKTYVLPREYLEKASNALYSPSVPTETADRLQFSNAVSISRHITNNNFHAFARQEPERFEALEKAGFLLERYGELQHHVNERLGGHYIDVGASAKISSGLIKLKAGVAPVSYTVDGLLFSDGSELKADVIVFATGFIGNLRKVVRGIFGEDVHDRVEDFWGLNPEGELYGAFKPTGHPGLWYIGGALGHARYFSRFIALQIKADLLGTPLPIFSK